MLANFKESKTFTADFMIDQEKNGVTNKVRVGGFTATINSEDPENMSIMESKPAAAIYKEHRAEYKENLTDFENQVYAVQDAMIAEKKAAEAAKQNTTTE